MPGQARRLQRVSTKRIIWLFVVDSGILRYYLPDEKLVTAAMRPSSTLNAIIDGSVSSKL